ncbi:hypothetical protein B0H11DRAFT_2107808, partial [Mycena galericulata]
MGGFWSCCRRDKSPERDPLIPKSRATEQPSHSSFEKLGDIIGAINSGKFPSQDQISALLQQSLRSELLRDPEHTLPTHGGALSQRGVILLLETRQLVDSVLRIGLEKNYDNKLQDLLFESTRTNESTTKLVANFSLDANSSQELSEDAGDFVQSLKSLAQLTITSSAFRMLLSDILGTTREIVAEAASEIGEIASQVQAAAVDGKAQESYSGLQQSVGTAHRNLGTLGDDSAERARDLVVGRVQELVIQAQKNPQHRAAIRTILVLFHKYSDKISVAAKSAEEPITIEAQVDASPPFYEAVVDFKVLLERLASGRSLDPLLQTFKSAIGNVLNAPNETHTEVRRYFNDLGLWLERALAEPQFAARTPSGLTTCGSWSGGAIVCPGLGVGRRHTETDPVSRHGVLSALRGLAQDTVASGVSTQRKLRDELLKDALGWLVPRILKSNSTFDIANWSEIKVDMAADASPETSSKTRVHIDGCAALRTGLAVDLELETTQRERDAPGQPLFRLTHVNVAVPGLAFGIKHSKHWILNNIFLQPLAVPVVRLVLKRIAEQQIQGPLIEDYWTATLLTAPAFLEKRVRFVCRGAHRPTLKGVIHTTTTLPEDPSGSASPEQTVLAVWRRGAASQTSGGPYGVEEVGADDVVREVVDHSVGKTREV